MYGEGLSRSDRGLKEDIMDLLKSLTPVQRLAILIGVLTATAGSSAQLQDILLSVAAVKAIVAACALGATLLSVVLTVATSQSGQVQAVKKMPGVENIQVNDQATPALAAMAMDPGEGKVEPAPGQTQKVAQLAQQAATG
jgi:hypothetical protein